MLDVVFADTLAKAAAWEQQARERRAISRTDPVADTLDHCAKDLRAAVREMEHGADYLTPDQYGQLCSPPVSPQTVTRWIRRGELSATETPTGYMIRRTAKRQRRKRPA